METLRHNKGGGGADVMVEGGSVVDAIINLKKASMTDPQHTAKHKRK
jgi:hypothetical protein